MGQARWQRPEVKPDREGKYQRLWGSNDNEFRIDYYDGECWKSGLNGITAPADMKWRLPQEKRK